MKTRSVKSKSHKKHSFEKDIVIDLLSLLNTIKIYHWRTRSYATHKATDELYSKLNNNIDRFIEVLLGKFGNRIHLITRTIPIHDFNNSEQVKVYIADVKSYLVNLDNILNKMNMTNSDLFTIRDDILADLNQFLYLLSFK